MTTTSQKIAHAYGVMVSRGDKITLRAVQKEAGVRMNDVANWMREYATAPAGEVPEAPDFTETMSAMVQAVWAAAWKRAAEQVDEVTEVALNHARVGEADALAAAERAVTERDEAISTRDRAVAEADRLRDDLDELRGQLEAARREAGEARDAAEQADRSRHRAEATSDTLREVLEAMREGKSAPKD